MIFKFKHTFVVVETESRKRDRGWLFDLTNAIVILEVWVWRLAQQFLYHIICIKLLDYKVLVVNVCEVQIKKLHLHAEDKSWAHVLALWKDADLATTFKNNSPADGKAHAYSFVIESVVLRKLAESFEQLVLLDRVDSSSWVSDWDAQHLVDGIVGCSDFDLTQDCKL